ncbi:hypothetical protein ACFYVL_07320 [Streptomyces sp. NPDC004111]
MISRRRTDEKSRSLAQLLGLAAIRGWCAGMGRSAADCLLRLLLDR